MRDSRQPTRFCGPGYLIDIRRLERETLPVCLTGFGLGAVLLLAVLLLVPYHPPTGRVIPLSERRDAIPIDIVIRPPRPRQPFILRRSNPEPAAHRRLRSFRERTPDTSALPDSIVTDSLADRLARPDNYPVDAGIDFTPVLPRDLPPEIKAIIDPPPFEPERVYTDMTIRRDPLSANRRRIDIREELVAVKDFDYGAFMAALATEDGDRQTLRGFVHIPGSIHGADFRPPEADRFLIAMAEAVRSRSLISTVLDRPLSLDDPALTAYPFIYLAADDMVSLTPGEATALGDYLLGGGFALVRAAGETTDGIPRGALPLRQVLADALGPRCRFDLIPNDHPLYHAVYDLDDGPPVRPQPSNNSLDARMVRILEGIRLGDRLAVIFLDRPLVEGEPEKKFLVNVLAFALLQDGAKTLKIMDGVISTYPLTPGSKE